MAYTIKRQFRIWQKEHPNFITPHIVKTEQKGRFIIEISEGDFGHKKIYGVTLLEAQSNGKFESIRGKSFHTKEQADKYAGELKNGI